MKKLITAVLLLMTLATFGQETLLLDKIKVYDWGGTAPAVLYRTNNNPGLPLVIFAHGKGEAGTGGTALWNNGLPAALKTGFRPPYPCVIIAPQHGSWSPSSSWLPWIIKDAVARFSIDTNRIWLTGLSAGGDLPWGGVLDVAPEVAVRIAAIAPLSGNITNANWNNINRFKTNKTPVWTVFGDATTSDATEWSFRERTQERVKQINALVPGLAELYIRPNMGHCCCVDVYNGTYKDSKGRTIWDFFKDKNTGVTIPPVQPPVITVPATLKGTVGTAFYYQVTASGTPSSYGATTLPAGLSINTVNGQISGTPLSTGITAATITATNAGGNGTAVITFDIAPKPKDVDWIQTIDNKTNPACSMRIIYYKDGTFITEKL